MTTDSKVKALQKKVVIPDEVNVVNGQPILSAKQATMLGLLGNPRVDMGKDCQAVTNPSLKPLIVTQSVGPFKATGLLPAVESLRAVMDDIKNEKPDIYNALGSMGMLCVRWVRGSTTSISNHSWGTAIDLTIGGVLDTYGDGTVQQGLTEIAPIFNRHRWFWGAAFGKEDGMHFECSDTLIREWAKTGLFSSAGTPAGTTPGADVLSLGDRGPYVRALQQFLNAEGAQLLVDGEFGRDTQAAVMRFQIIHGLTADGVVGHQTWAKMEDAKALKQAAQ